MSQFNKDIYNAIVNGEISGELSIFQFEGKWNIGDVIEAIFSEKSQITSLKLSDLLLGKGKEFLVSLVKAISENKKNNNNKIKIVFYGFSFSCAIDPEDLIKILEDFSNSTSKNLSLELPRLRPLFAQDLSTPEPNINKMIMQFKQGLLEREDLLELLKNETIKIKGLDSNFVDQMREEQKLQEDWNKVIGYCKDLGDSITGRVPKSKQQSEKSSFGLRVFVGIVLFCLGVIPLIIAMIIPNTRNWLRGSDNNSLEPVSEVPNLPNEGIEINLNEAKDLLKSLDRKFIENFLIIIEQKMGKANGLKGHDGTVFMTRERLEDLNKNLLKQNMTMSKIVDELEKHEVVAIIRNLPEMMNRMGRYASDEDKKILNDAYDKLMAKIDEKSTRTASLEKGRDDETTHSK